MASPLVFQWVTREQQQKSVGQILWPWVSPCPVCDLQKLWHEEKNL
jgi:hypothetical protein